MKLDSLFLKISFLLPKKWRWVLEHEGFKKYFANTGWMFLGKAVNLIIGFFVGIWIIRYLGPENFGIFSYAIAFVGLFSFVASLGIDNILHRELVNQPEKRDLLLGTAFWLRLTGGALAIILAISTIFFIEGSLLIRFLVAIYSFVYIVQSLSVIIMFFYSKVESKKVVTSQTISALISAILKVVLILTNSGIIWLTLIYLFDTVWTTLFLIISYRRSGFKIKDWQFDLSIAKRMLSDSWLLALTNVSVLIYMKIDQVMIKQMIDEFAVGLYSAAVRLFEFTYIIPNTICASLMPAILNARMTDKKIYFQRLKNLSILLFILSLIVALLISLLAQKIIVLLFGIEFIGSVIVLKIGTWSLVGISLGAVVGQYLIAENYIKTYFYITLIGAIINIGLNYIIIPIYGIGGASLTTVFSYLVVPFSLFLFKNKKKLSSEK